ncbi:RIP metalloprotease RseP [Patescibacteria group bacterium]
MIISIITFVVVFSIIIFVHELGHFFTAKKFGVNVEEFGFGFPPRIFGIKRGKTIYSINWIPFGGFVRLKGEGGENKDDSDSFASKSVFKRSIILSSGVIMNVILAMVLLIISYNIGVPSTIDENTSGNITNRQVQIVEIEKNTPAEQAELKPADIIKSINNQIIISTNDLQTIVRSSEGTALNFEVVRDEDTINKTIIPEKLEDDLNPKIGVSLVATGIIKFPWYQTIWEGTKNTVILIWEIIKGFSTIIKDLVITQKVSVDIAGPVGIAVLTGRVADLGILYILQFIIVLSLTLAVINIVPFPALDGGRLLFVIIEKIRGRPMNQKVEGLIHGIGFYLLIIMLIVVSFRDVQRFEIGTKINDLFKNIF